jgi:hypothetical protein
MYYDSLLSDVVNSYTHSIAIYKLVSIVDSVSSPIVYCV